MALTVDYSTIPFLITVPQSDLTLDTGTKYTLTVDEFWILLRDFTDNENTMAQPKLYTRIPATATTPSITNVNSDFYELEFEDGLYSVNIINGNTNIRDVEVKNQVSVNTNNTAGFIDSTGFWTDDLVEDYPADGQSSLTATQLLYSINQLLSEFERLGLNVSVKKRNGTEAYRLLLDSATAPTSSTQST